MKVWASSVLWEGGGGGRGSRMALVCVGRAMLMVV